MPTPPAVDVTDPANTPDVIRASDMYKNFYSAQAATVLGTPTQSRLLTKPLVQGVLHGGGIVFDSARRPERQADRVLDQPPGAAGQDEFSTAADSMFTPADPNTGACNTQ